MKKIIFPLLLLIALIIFFLGFIEIDNSTKTDNKEGIVYSINEIKTELKKVSKLSHRDMDIICATSRGLVEKDSDGKIMPSLAKEIIVRENGIEYEFLLKDDIYWSNGEKITPQDISDFLKELIKEEDEENIAALLSVYGAKEFKNSTGTFEKGVAIITSENSIKIRLNEKNDNFIEELTKPQYRLRKYLPLWDNLKDSYATIIYSGTYRIDEIEDNRMVLVKSASNEEKGGSDKLIFVENSSDELAMASFEVGESDVILNPPNSQLERLYNEKRLISFPSNKGLYAAFNREKEGLTVSARKEIFKIITDATIQYEISNIQMIEVAEGSYFRSDKTDLSKLQTRKVSINEEGEWSKPQIITLLGENNEINRDLCKYLTEWFKEKEDIILKYTLVESDKLKDTDVKKGYDIVLVELEGNSNEKELFYSELNDYLSSTEKEILKNKMDNVKDQYSKIENELFNTYGIVPILYENTNIAVSKNLNLINFDGNGNVDFSSIK